MHYITISQIAYFFPFFSMELLNLIKGLAATKDHLLKLLVRYAIDLCMCVLCVHTYACFILTSIFFLHLGHRFDPPLHFDYKFSESGQVLHDCESELVCRWTLNQKVPYFNAGIYLENKRRIGKVDEILGKVAEIFFTVKMDPGVLSKSFQPNDLLYIGTDKLLPLTRFTNPNAPGGRSSGGRGRGRGGRGGGRGGRGGRGSSGGGRGRGGRDGGRGRGRGSFSPGRGRGRGRGRY